MLSLVGFNFIFVALFLLLVHADSFGFRRLCLLPPYTWFLQVCFQPRRGRRRPCLLSLCGAVPDVPDVMSQQQHWPLSQSVGKHSGTCSVCLATRQLHLKDGRIHKHGPRDKPCPGSNKPPLDDGTSSNVSPTVADSLQSSSVSTPDQPSSLPALSPHWSPPSANVIKHIPKSARPACASHLASLLREVVSHSETLANWISVFNWPAFILQPPKRGGRRHNLTTTIRSRISTFSGSAPQVPMKQAKAKTAPTGSQASMNSTLLSQAVTAKLEDGNIRAAIRILNSEDTPEPPSLASLSQLQEKHPTASGMDPSLPPPSQFSCLSVDENEVRKAALSFPAGSSAGPDGLRPQHLRDLLLCREGGGDFLTSLTAFVNLILSGQCPPDASRIFFGGRLLALKKKTGGIRPIAVGFTLRRLASKCANASGVSRLSSYFSPRQLGVGIRGGCEAAVHSARRFLESLQPGHVFVKLDFSNAFNSLHRSEMLQSVADRVPDLYAYCYSSYYHPSVLFHGAYTILSQEGPQQGDPLGPLLFCNTIQPLLQSLTADLNLGFLDDLSLGGLENVVADDIEKVVEEGERLGLVLNTSKCELITHRGFDVQSNILRSFRRVDMEEAILLGAPMFAGPALDDAWSNRCDDLTRAVDRLTKIGSQEALILLRASFSAPKVLHLLRSLHLRTPGACFV